MTMLVDMIMTKGNRKYHFKYVERHSPQGLGQS
jgi:hypothetical protein